MRRGKGKDERSKVHNTRIQVAGTCTRALAAQIGGYDSIRGRIIHPISRNLVVIYVSYDPTV